MLNEIKQSKNIFPSLSNLYYSLFPNIMDLISSPFEVLNPVWRTKPSALLPGVSIASEIKQYVPEYSK